MKGQPKADQMRSPSTIRRSKGSIGSERGSGPLIPVPEGVSQGTSLLAPALEEPEEEPAMRYRKQRSQSHETKTGVVWDDLNRTPSVALVPVSGAFNTEAEASPLVANRALYRRHRGMRLAVLEASKQFDRKRNERVSLEIPTQAGLIMKRGVRPPVELEDAHTRALFDAAAKRCGRARRTKYRTVSDVTGMILKAQV